MSVVYMHIYSSGPMMIVRMPKPMPVWRDILKALTGVMRSHGLKQKDISSLEQVEQEEKWISTLDRAYAGQPSEVLKEFWLYDWTKGSFSLFQIGNS